MGIWSKCPPSPERISSGTPTREMTAVEMDTRLRRSTRDAKGTSYMTGIGMEEERFRFCS